MKTPPLLSLLALCTLCLPPAALAGEKSPPATQLGDPLPGLTAEEFALFQQGKDLFLHDTTVSEGLGPLFNGTACSTCHNGPVTGGSEHGTANNVHHITLENDGQTYLAFELGGPVRQSKSITGMPGAGACNMPPKHDPVGVPGAQVSIRHTPPVFGFGLLDAVPDAEILELQGHAPFKQPGVFGVANWGVELEGLDRLLAFALDPTRTQVAGPPRVARFGWKSSTATLFQFSTEPFNIELGVSTPFFPRENATDGTKIPSSCLVAGSQPNDTRSQRSLRLYYFQAFLAPPPKGPSTPGVARGGELFFRIGCADCHRPQLRTVEDYYVPLADGTPHRVAALSGKTLEPYSDLLLHDMGPALADHRPQGRASGRFWRTTPLWGIRFKSNYLHDGSATTEEQAVLAHGGEGTTSTRAFQTLPSEDRARVVQFLESL